MRSKKQHFLPVFFLKAWESKKNRIHLFDTKTGITRNNVGLRGQCQKHLYYMNQHNEDILREWDNRFSQACRQVRTSQRLPDPTVNIQSYVDLFAFILAQHARTPAQAEKIRQIYSQLIPSASKAIGAPPGEISIKYDFPQLEAVEHSMNALKLMDDLVPHLITSHSDRFLTSDNPAFFYNQLCQNLDGATAGVDNHGFQAFCPISPNTVVMLFDPMSYELTSEASTSKRRSEAKEEDIQQLNRIQALSAIQNLYANDLKLLKDAPALLQSVSAEREAKEPILNEYESAESGNASKLFVQHNPIPNLAMNLSFIRVRQSAEKMPSVWKLHDYRHEPNKVPQMISEGSPVKIFTDPNNPTVSHVVADVDSTQQRHDQTA